MSSDESDSPTGLAPPGLLRINNQSPSLITNKQENGTPTIHLVPSSINNDTSNISAAATVLMPIVSKANTLPLGSAVKVREKYSSSLVNA